MGQKRVLLIEDEPNIAEAIRFILSRDGWIVSSHGDGADAVEVVRRERPDVLVLDVMLPGRSGLDILADLRADPRYHDLPVLVLSAAGQGSAREAAERAGADRFIMKPFSNADILASVRALAGA
ncbi:MAG: response regulator transcription factor [Pseudomonadota bacterium]